MGNALLPREILEHLLQFADGETLLTCKEVSPEFEAAVNYLSRTKNIWEKCYLREKRGKHPYCVISKFHPHNEGLTHPINWDVIYEASFQRDLIHPGEKPHLRGIKIGKGYSDIEAIETHGDLVLLLVKYNKDFAIFYRILTLNQDNMIIDKSCRFNADKVYITPIEDITSVKRDAIILSCDECQLVAVPVNTDAAIEGFPRFSKNIDFLTVEQFNGDVIWINNFRALLSKGNCFHVGKDSKPESIKKRHSDCVKVFHRFTSLFVSCGETHRVFNTFRLLRANVTASFCYSNLLILGTETGMLYVYQLSDESELNSLDLKYYLYNIDVCSGAILTINVMELKSEFAVVCCTAKDLYRIHMKRNLNSLV